MQCFSHTAGLHELGNRQNLESTVICSSRDQCQFCCPLVTVKSLRSYPSKMECMDKFLIHSTDVGYGTREDVAQDLATIMASKYEFTTPTTIFMTYLQSQVVKTQNMTILVKIVKDLALYAHVSKQVTLQCSSSATRTIEGRREIGKST